jgi:mismatch-specific thymine-DNA glycosylase
VGINPSLYAVHKGHHYGGPGNHFWKLLHMSSLIPTAFSANDDYRVPQYGIGFTNIVQRPTKAGSDITKYKTEKQLNKMLIFFLFLEMK